MGDLGPGGHGPTSATRASRMIQSAAQRRSVLLEVPPKPKRTVATRVRIFFAGLILAVVAYYAVGIGAVYIRYWQLLNEMQVDAEIASSLNDQAIRKRLILKAERLDLPEAARKFQIRRRRNPPTIDISSQYEATISLPFYQLRVMFRPRTQAQLSRVGPTVE